MKKPATSAQFGFSAIMGLAIALASPVVSAQYNPPSGGCPSADFVVKLKKYGKPDSTVPTEAPGSFCDFNQTTFEAFVWATTMINGVPRFLTLKTPDQLNLSPGVVTPSTAPATPNKGGVRLSLGTRAHAAVAGQPPGVGAIVEADNHMLVGRNGYPILGSVHMNDSYFNTAQQNLIITGGYTNNPNPAANFNVGAAVFKATWMRVGNGVSAPVGSYTTKANVPVLALTTVVAPDGTKSEVVAPDGNKTMLVDVALLGLHVVVSTVDHPEFLWGSFEHKLNSPQVAGAYNPLGSSNKNFTLYTAGTLFKNTNVANLSNNAQPLNGATTFNPTTQTFAPIVNVALINPTGGDTSGTVTPVTVAGQAFLQSQKSVFANYFMLGTVWFPPNAYVAPSGCAVTPQPAACNFSTSEGVGSVTLANSTAETFDQAGQPTAVFASNCFSCHKATSFSRKSALAPRLIAISHVLAQGCATPYGTPNQVVMAGPGTGAGTPCVPFNPPPKPAATPQPGK